MTAIVTSYLALGIDVGGTGIKGAPVDVSTGELIAERHRIPTPVDSTPEAVAAIVAQIAEHFAGVLPPDAPVGVTFPGVVQHGTVRTAANVDRAWIDYPGEQLFSTAMHRPCVLVNDADAAGVAEARFGAAKDATGFVIVTTLGTGIGVALLHGGQLIPNAELGHIEIGGDVAEKVTAASAKERDDLSYEKWAKRLQKYYSRIENLLWPDLFIVGGGISKKAHKFLPLLNLRTPIRPAILQNNAGIIGAAALAASARDSPTTDADVGP
ncbi:MAG TPA: ROK family protein [Ornithinibacter sp.]|nr:ROK family protein [Ornithinibacter sp.]